MSEFDEAKKLLESTGHLVVEKREKKTFDTFMTYLLDQNGRCSADGGDYTFYCLKLNDENFLFGSLEGFRSQIKDEGLYDWAYIAGIIPNGELEKTGGKVPVTWLPIFGNRERYVTKWLQNGSPSGAVAEIFRDRRMKVKDRIDYFAIPEDELLSLNELKEELEKLGLPCRIRSDRKGDYLETNLEFSQEACKKWNDIPISSGHRIVSLIRNKFVINKHKFNSVQKVVDYFKENKGLYELAEANEIIKKLGKKLVKESRDYARFERQYCKNDTVITLRKKDRTWGEKIDTMVVPTKGLSDKEAFDLCYEYFYKIVDKNLDLIEENPDDYFIDHPNGRHYVKDFL
jgi:hypothetical protein